VIFDKSAWDAMDAPCIVPVPVIGPPVRIPLVATDVTVPADDAGEVFR
jgi:hypothetical protein